MRVVHCKREPFDVYIGRPSKWGNPFSHMQGTLAEYVCESREEAICRYEEWVRMQPDLIASLHEIRGKVLGCWCVPKACHGDILIKILKETESSDASDEAFFAAKLHSPIRRSRTE